jgi:phosphatidylglycerol:prolipoprotein diacylglycerol transferase
MVPTWRVGWLEMPVHGVFVGLGVIAASVVFIL